MLGDMTDRQTLGKILLLVKPIEGIAIDPNKDIIPIEGFTI